MTDPHPIHVALGDALSTDDFAGGPGAGAAALLYRDNGIFDGFEGLDLVTILPGCDLVDLARPGSTTAAVAAGQVPAISEMGDDIRIVTLTAGRDDLLQIWGAELQTGEIAARDLVIQLDEILGDVRRAVGDETLVIVATIPDPTDGTGDWESIGGETWEDGTHILDLFNRVIEDTADEHEAEVADLHGRFLGHGLAAMDPDHPRHDPDDPSIWFVEGVELNERGASELRRLFWEIVEVSL